MGKQNFCYVHLSKEADQSDVQSESAALKPIVLSLSVHLPAVLSPLPACLLSSNLRLLQRQQLTPWERRGAPWRGQMQRRPWMLMEMGTVGFMTLMGGLSPHPRPKGEEREARVLPTSP